MGVSTHFLLASQRYCRCGTKGGIGRLFPASQRAQIPSMCFVPFICNQHSLKIDVLSRPIHPRLQTTLNYIRKNPRSWEETALLLVMIVVIVAWLGKQLYNARELHFAYGDEAPPGLAKDGEDDDVAGGGGAELDEHSEPEEVPADVKKAQ